MYRFVNMELKHYAIFLCITWTKIFFRILCENDISVESVLNVTDTNINQSVFYGKPLPFDSQFDVSHCPNPQDIAPCTCEGPPGFLHLMCNQLRHVHQLKRVLRANFPVKDFGKLSLINSDIPMWRDGLLETICFEYIFTHKTTLIRIHPRAFGPSETSAKRLEIVHNDLETFPFSSVSAFHKLEQLLLYYNGIQIIPDYAFGLHAELKEINLSFNKIHYIGSYAFENLLALRIIDLRYNKLFILNNFAFAVKLVNPNLLLDLSNNNIVFISKETFTNQVPKLLNISNNHLKSLSMSNFESMLQTMTTEKYGTIVARGNRFLCTCDTSAWWTVLPYMSKQHIKEFKCSDLNKNLIDISLEDIGCLKN
ncbi:uncharacterized protein LOC143238281 [Tachypleus tridentatus]|uniref:uncharacterized protein LOC143238281 n=1 Tax=Tachypleus tridentatus TaxID=6853 RepID=UPI003FD53A92